MLLKYDNISIAGAFAIALCATALPAMATSPTSGSAGNADQDASSTSQKHKSEKSKTKGKHHKPIIRYKFIVQPPTKIKKPETPKKLYKFVVRGRQAKHAFYPDLRGNPWCRKGARPTSF